MTVGPRRFQYPKTPEEARFTPWDTAHRVYGKGTPEALFHGSLKTGAPWGRAAKPKEGHLYDQERVNTALRNPGEHIKDIDPRFLHSTQPSVTEPGVAHYMGDQWRKTGQTYADMGKTGNRYPFVYTDTQGRNLLLSGHHRATAALLKGEPLRGIHIEENDE